MKLSNSIRFATALTACVVSGCEDTADDPQTSEEVGGTGDEPMCDPQGADPEMGALLNAPLAADVEVIEKVPMHPGMPGPANLP